LAVVWHDFILPAAGGALMLSIGKLAVGQERYYEQQVAKGVDDYFTGRAESEGRWLGRGAAELGLHGRFEEGQLGVLMQGRDPRKLALVQAFLVGAGVRLTDQR
jgi:hypothetical protein